MESDLARLDRAPALSHYDTVVLGGFVRAGKIQAAGKFLTDNWDSLQGKKVVLFVVGAAPPEFPGWNKLYEEQIPEPIRRQLTFFTLQGRLIHEDLDLRDRMLMKVGIMMEKDPMTRAAMKRGVDGVNRKNVQPIIDLLQSKP